MEQRERCYSFILSRTPHETDNTIDINNWLIVFIVSIMSCLIGINKYSGNSFRYFTLSFLFTVSAYIMIVKLIMMNFHEKKIMLIIFVICVKTETAVVDIQVEIKLCINLGLRSEGASATWWRDAPSPVTSEEKSMATDDRPEM
jgi:predicted neutral ceramidase superfamily lipid hydrolase